MKYFFILGNNPALSKAEIQSLFPGNKTGKILAGNVFILETDEFDAKVLIGRMGGTKKIGVIAGEANRHDNEKIKDKILKIINDDLAEKNPAGKYCFGLSHYGQSKLPVFPIGLAIKKILKEKAVASRLVTSKEKTLSSVVVEQNILRREGLEIVLVEEAGTIYLGYTAAVQPFKELSFRDYGRPARDDQSGMIPPKLAQIMINLSEKFYCHCEEEPLATTKPACRSGRQPRDCFASARNDINLLDPFCGSGTILMEAALMGVGNLIGADISEKAIADTEKNFQWLKKNFQLPIFNFQLFNASVMEISQKIPANSVDAIVTEPYLGPQRGWHDIKKTVKELENLYSQAIKEFKKILKPDGAIVIIFPVFTSPDGRKKDFLNPDLAGLKLSCPRKTLIYGREGQKIWREIIILKK